MKLNETTTEHIFLYLFAASKHERLYQLQMESLVAYAPESLEQDIIIAEVFENGEGHIGSSKLPRDKCQELWQQYHILPSQFKIVLVGRDSTVILCSESCVSYEEVVMRIKNESHKMN